MDPGATIWITPGACPCIEVGVYVGPGVMVGVGSGVLVGVIVGMDAKKVAVAESPADCAVMAMTVGRYSGGYGVGMGIEVGEAQAAKSPRREAKRMMIRFMEFDS